MPTGSPEQNDRSFRSLLDDGARLAPEHGILEAGNTRLTRDQLRRAVERAAARLAPALRPGAPVALLFHNSIECVIGFLALAWLNASVVPLEPETPAAAMESLRAQVCFEMLIGHRQTLSRLEEGRVGAGRTRRSIAVEDLASSNQPAAPVPEPAAPSPDSVFLYHYSSGTTGAPKAALHPERNLLNGARLYQETFSLTPDDVILAAVPLLHSFGMVAGLATSLVAGARLLVASRFVPDRLLRTLADERVTVLLGVPFIYDLLTRLPPHSDLTLDRLRLCLSSGGPLPPGVAKRWLTRHGAPICQIYGCTEVGLIAAQRPADLPQPAGTVGSPVSGVEVRIVDDRGGALPRGSLGAIMVKTPAMFLGYHGHPATTADVMRDGWYATGDAGHQDDAGRLFVVGRKATFVNVGGKKVNPTEVEATLTSHPSVEEAAVWGESDGATAERVRAAVATSAAVSTSELLAWCRERLLPHQVPVRIDYLPSLPRTSAGKVRRGELADLVVRTSTGF